MTIQDLAKLLGEYPLAMLMVFITPAIIAWLLSIKLKAKTGVIAKPLRALFSVLTYVVCVPGIFSVVLVAYTMFFQRADLTKVNILVYFLPVVSMVVTLAGIKRSITFDDIPGFDRLSGLMATIGVTFVIALGIEKSRIWVMFHGSIWLLFGLAAVLFILLHMGARKLFKD